MRIQRAITDSGLASRREAEQLLQEGRVTCNGSVIYQSFFEVDITTDIILLDGKPLPAPEVNVYYMLNKPKGCITSRKDPENRESVYDILQDIPYRIEAVGRLDIQTTGLLLFTNDGTLAHKLTHPSLNVPKKYLVKVWKKPDERKLKRIANGINLDDGRTKPARVRIVDITDTNNTWLEITVTEGRNRLIRRMFEAVGHPVNKLKRLSFATISLGNLEPGNYRVLNGEEIQRLKDISSGIAPQNAGHKTRYKKGFARPKPKKNKPLSKKKARNKINRKR
jgi:23S rRNA pseudouridine2605 synthase